MEHLNLGQTALGKPFMLPEEALVQTFAVIGVRGAGKTTLEAVMQEEFCRLRFPWIMLDPPGVGWGLRVGKDGKPGGGLPVVVFGGEHGDLPLVKDQGAKIAEAIIESNVCSIIDLKNESKTTWRKFITDFCLKLLDMTPRVPWHIFIEEAGELVPQKTRVQVTAQCKEAVERLVRQGRNNGYGCTLFNQRPATVDKDVLSQCENLVMLRIYGKHDRRALMEWLEPKFAQQYPEDEKRAASEAKRLVNSLAALADGSAYFWSPSWLKLFQQFQIRDRKTFHPGATRRDMRAAPGVKAVEMADVGAFVEKMKGILSRAPAKNFFLNEQHTTHVKKGAKPSAVAPAYTPEEEALARPSAHPEIDHAEAQHKKLLEAQQQLKDANARIADLESRNTEMGTSLHRLDKIEAVLKRVREALRPQYEAMHVLFSDLNRVEGSSPVNRAIYEPWLKKAAVAGCRRLLELLIEKGQMTRQQLSTLGGVPMNSTFRRYVTWLKRNSLVQLDGDGPQGSVKLVEV